MVAINCITGIFIRGFPLKARKQALQSKPTFGTHNQTLQSDPTIKTQPKPTIKAYSQTNKNQQSNLQSKPTMKPTIKTNNQNIQSKPTTKTYNQQLQTDH